MMNYKFIMMCKDHLTFIGYVTWYLLIYYLVFVGYIIWYLLDVLSDIYWTYYGVFIGYIMEYSLDILLNKIN